MRLGIVSAYPPRRGDLAARAADLAQALAAEFDVAVCAVDAHGTVYPDEVVTVIAPDDVEEYRRAARVLAEHAVDAVLILYDDETYGGPSGSHICHLASDLTRRGIGYLVALPDARWLDGGCRVRATTALTGGATRVLVCSDEARRLAVARGLAREAQVAVVPTGGWQITSLVQESAAVSLGHARGSAVPLPVGDPLLTIASALGPGGSHRGTPPCDAEVYARLAVVSASASVHPAAVLAGAGWSRWLDDSVRILAAEAGDGAQVFARSTSDRGWIMWGLGAVAAGPAVPAPLRRAARRRRDALSGSMPQDLRASAYGVLGLCQEARLGPAARLALVAAANWLDGSLRGEAWRGPSWRWFADRLGREDARLPQALICAGRRLRHAEMIGRGLDALDWYCGRVGLATADGRLRLPPRAGPAGESEPAIDAAALVEALVEAYRSTGSIRYARLARRAFDWFLGVNQFAEPVYRDELGACRDGASRWVAMMPTTVTATLAYLGALNALVSADLVLAPAADSARREFAAVA